LSTYPSGAGVFYVIPQNSGYINPNSQREYFTITNSDPTLSDTLSFFQIGDSSETQFSSTTEDDSIIPQFATQDDIISFRVSVNDAEDLDANLTVSVNLFMGTLSEPNIEGTSTISLIIPSQYVVSILNYDGTSHSGALKIPRTMLYSTIAGNKEVSTSANLQQQDDYIGILYINVLDSEGNSIDDPFFIALSISAAFEWMPFIIILVVIGAIVGVGALVYAIRRKRISGDSERTSGDYEGSSDQGWQGYDTESSSSSSNSDSPIDVDGLYYCPFCGQKLDNLNRYCPNCGKSLSFD
jgi:hypothetical protein